MTHAKRTFHCICGKTVHGNGGISAHKKACAVSGSTPIEHRNDASGVQASDRYQQSNGPAMVREALKTTLEIAAAAGVKGPEHG